MNLNPRGEKKKNTTTTGGGNRGRRRIFGSVVSPPGRKPSTPRSRNCREKAGRDPGKKFSNGRLNPARRWGGGRCQNGWGAEVENDKRVKTFGRPGTGACGGLSVEKTKGGQNPGGGPGIFISSKQKKIKKNSASISRQALNTEKEDVGSFGKREKDLNVGGQQK